MTANVFATTFKPLFGQPWWGIEFNHRLNLSMNFGEPSLRIREPHKRSSKSEGVQRMAARRQIKVRGEWFLWIFCCYWRLTSNDQLLVTGSCSSRRIQKALQQLG